MDDPSLCLLPESLARGGEGPPEASGGTSRRENANQVCDRIKSPCGSGLEVDPDAAPDHARLDRAAVLALDRTVEIDRRQVGFVPVLDVLGVGVEGVQQLGED